MRTLVAIVLGVLAVAPAAAASERLAVVQLAGPTTDASYGALEASGVRIVWYQPQFAYLVRGSDAQLARVAKGPGVRSVTPYTAADKLLGAPAGEVAVSVLTGADGRRARAAAGPSGRPVAATDGVATRYANLRPADARRLAADAGVVAIASAPELRPGDERAGQILLDRLDGAYQPVLGGGYLDGLAQLGVGPSEGFVVDVTDTGLDTGSLPVTDRDFRELGNPADPWRIAYLHDETADPDARDCWDHGTHVASTVTGYNAENSAGPPATAAEDAEGFNYGLGIAPYARIGATKIFSCALAGADVERSFPEIVADAYGRGARISNNSWGDTSFLNLNRYTQLARQYDALVRDAQPSAPGNQQLVEVFIAGNGADYEEIEPPGTAKNVITVGASESVRPLVDASPGACRTDVQADNARDIARFTSRGPTSDGRTKPDLVAPGTHIVSAISHADPADVGFCGPFPVGSLRYEMMNGTSMAAPHVTGAAALMRDWYRRTRGNGLLEPSPAMTKALLLNTATDLVGGDEGRFGPTNPPVPARSQGWGRVNLGRLFDPGDHRVLRDQTQLMHESGEVSDRTFTVADPSRPIKVTLAWTDAPGAVSSGGSWVNDLDLSVSKDGTWYRGNVFAGGMSTAGEDPDRRNNVENVFLPGSAGTFHVAVSAFNIAGDGVPGNTDATDQDYALVVSNAEPAPEGAVARDGEIEVIDRGDGDDRFEPGERVGLRVRAINAGDGPLSGATATLSGDLAPVAPSATYPTLAVGHTEQRELVGRIPSTAPCGSVPAAVVTLAQPGAVPDSTAVPVSLGGDAAPATFSQTHVPPLPIPDNESDSASSTLFVPFGRPVRAPKVRIDALSHAFVGDLKVTLTAPDGRTVVLADRPGPPPFGSPANDLSGITFDDDAAQPITAIPVDDAPLPPGSYRPDEPLGELAGSELGDWTLTVFDGRAGVPGTLGGWSLIARRWACENPAAATTGAASNVGARVATVSGQVDAGGVPTGYRVEYGRTTAYGTTTTARSAGDARTVRVSVALAGLAPSTRYHYRVVAVRAGAVVATGDDATLTTARAPATSPPPPPPVRPSVSFATTKSTLRVNARRRFTLRFTGTPGATGTLTARKVRRAFRVGIDGRGKVTIRLSKRTFRTLVRRKRLRVLAKVTLGAQTFTHPLTLKPPRRRR